MSHQISKTLLVTALSLTLVLLFHASIGSAIDKKFQSQQISIQSGQDNKIISSSELQQIGDRLKAKLSSSKTQNVRTSHLSQVLQGKNPYLFSLNKINSASGQSGLTVFWNEKNSTPRFISVRQQSGRLSKPGGPLAAKAMAIEFFNENAALFQLENPEKELQAVDEVSDALGKTHVKFNQFYHGVPVWGHDIVAHLNENNQVYAINARYAPTPKSIDVNRLTISSQSAVQVARAELEKTMKIEQLPDWARSILNYQEPQAKKYIWIEDKSQQPRLVWHVQIRPNLRDNWYYFVDAQNGAILEKYNATNFNGPATAQALDLNGVMQTIHSYQVENTYYLIDASRPT